MSKATQYLIKVLTAHIEYYDLKEFSITSIEIHSHEEYGSTQIVVEHPHWRCCFTVPFPMATEDINQAINSIRQNGITVLWKGIP